MRWQRKARFGVAAFGIAVAVVVYVAMGQRQAAAPAPRPARFDPKAILESAGAVLQQFREARQDYVIEAERQLTYQGGATKLVGITIKVRGKAGRDFTVSAREAQARENRKELEITGGVTLMASDGFLMTTDRATFSEIDGTVRAPGSVSFEKGRMTGSGIGMSYDQNNDVLSLGEDAHVEVTDEDGDPTTDFTAGSATLARQDNYLALEGDVHALRGEQVLAADRGIAHLTENEEFITFIELRGNARVVGGDLFDSASARDIDLDYTDDGQALERVVLTGTGAIVLPGQDGAAGRQLIGDTLDLTFAPDGILTRAVGRVNVQFDFPAAARGPARSVKAQTFDAVGEAGKGLMSARFAENVEYREEGQRGGAARLARARALRLTFAEDTVTAASFTGSARFEEQGLQAAGAEAQYDPVKGTLQLSGTDGGGSPRVSDEQITVEADTIDLTLQGRRMTASGNVRTSLRPRAAAARPGGAGRGSVADGGSRWPGLLEQEQPANVNANTLEYQGATAKAIYSGQATLWQGETAIRADVLTLDQASGDLVAAGTARSNLALDTGGSVGRAGEIRYDDSTRRIIYSNAPAPTGISGIAPTSVSGVAPTSVSGIAPTSGSAVAPTSVSGPLVQLSGPQGDLRASRIELILAQAGGRAERLEAYRNVNIRLDMRVVTGDRLTYFAAEERYAMSGMPTVPVTVVEACRETSGMTVTFFKSTERIIVDGNEEARTQSKRGGPCPQPPAR